MKYIAAIAILLILSGTGWYLSVPRPLPLNSKATSIVIEKHKHLMTVYSRDRILRTYRVSLGRGDDGPKQQEGDNRTPEGRYFIDARNEYSQFYRSLHISYPSAVDVARAKRKGVSPGGAVMIHGLRRGLAWLGPLHRLVDWTKGCVAVTNSQMDELWLVVNVGTPVEIRQ
ncbi:MAG TPA: L,D-transpeptidase family protein [Steroidobacteraceae bacterium]|nr:L,D-transpeptidase family protein [Steroidobacteraceae bacterium]